MEIWLAKRQHLPTLKSPIPIFPIKSNDGDTKPHLSRPSAIGNLADSWRCLRHSTLQQSKIRKIHKARIINSHSEASMRSCRLPTSPRNPPDFKPRRGCGGYSALKAWCLDYISFVGIVIWWFCAQATKLGFLLRSSMEAAFCRKKSWLKFFLSKSRGKFIFAIRWNWVTIWIKKNPKVFEM